MGRLGRPHRYRDKYQLLKDEGKLHGTITAARALRRVRDSRHVVQDNIAHRRALFDACLGVAIPFGVVTTEYVTLTVTGEHPRKRKWMASIPTRVRNMTRPSLRTLYKGQHWRKRYQELLGYRPIMRSYAVITAGWMCWFIGTKHGMWKAKRGWQFASDGTGIYVVQNRRTALHDFSYRWRFNADNIFCGDGEKRTQQLFWSNAAAHVKRVEQLDKERKEAARLHCTTLRATVLLRYAGVSYAVELVSPAAASCGARRIWD